MKAISLTLTADVVSVYDQTKTTVLGRAAKKTLSALQGGKTVVGTPLVAFADIITDSALTGNRVCVSDNGHELHITASSAAGLASFILYDVNETTGVKTYVGKLQAQFPSTTHTWRGLRLVNDSGLTGWRIVVSSVGTIAANGGLFSLENIDKADFVQGTPSTIPTATAIGQKAVYWHQETGGTNLLTVCQGFGHEADGVVSGTKIIVANGLVAAPNFYTFDSANAITGVAAGGVTTDWYSHKTGTITGLTGTFLLLNNYSIAVPTADSMAPAGLQGETCLFIPGSTGFGLGKISELTSGATSWPSYASRDAQNTANTTTAATPATAHWSNTLQRIVFQQSNGQCYFKKFVNASYEGGFGDQSNAQYKTAQPVDFYEFGGISVTATYEHNGWLYTTQATAGQICGQAFDIRSMRQFDWSSIISKVIDVSNVSFVSFNLLAPVRSFGQFYYRQSNFGSATGGWIAVPSDRDMSLIANTTGQIQFKIQPRFDRDGSTIPLQIIEAHLIVQPVSEISDNWEYSFDNSSSGSPTRFAFRLKKTYTTSVPQLFFKAYDTTEPTNGLLLAFDTVNNTARFEYSTDDGMSWLPLGTIPNVVGTLIRVTPLSPPGVKVRPSIREA